MKKNQRNNTAQELTEAETDLLPVTLTTPHSINHHQSSQVAAMNQPHWKPDPMDTSTAQENGINEAGSEETDNPPPRSQIPAAGKILVWKSGRVAKKKTRDGENGARRNGKQKKPRPQRRGNGIPQHNSKVHIAPELPLGPVLSTIKRSDLSENEFPAYQAKVANVKDVASYSWVKGEESTIVVPGKSIFWEARGKQGNILMSCRYPSKVDGV